MAQAFQVVFVGGPGSGLPRAAIMLPGDTQRDILFSDSSPLPRDTSQTMNLPSSMFEPTLDWLTNESNPQLIFDAQDQIALLTATGDVAGEGEVVRTPALPAFWPG